MQNQENSERYIQLFICLCEYQYFVQSTFDGEKPVMCKTTRTQMAPFICLINMS
jgi:hypothetical protein